MKFALTMGFLVSLVSANAFGPFARAEILSPQAYLRKLSLHLRGLDPALEEYALLDVALAHHSDSDFFRRTIGEYLSSRAHVEKMNDRLSELFFLKSADVPADLAMEAWDRTSIRDNNSLNSLFREIAARNLSWDTLLTSKQYTLHYAANRTNVLYGDLGFYSALKPLPNASFGGTVTSFDDKTVNPTAEASLQTVTATFDPDDPRIAGSITTERFYERYTNTALNKNRRRSAAVFRIFLCDTFMPVVVPPDPSKLESLMNLALSREIPRPATTASSEQRHGEDSQCMTCHAQLDPLGHVFDTSGIALSSAAADGSLHYFDEFGTEQNIPVHGLGGLASALIKQPEYVKCQVRHFWDWFIGSDVELSRKRLGDLTETFNRVGRRTNDFIAELVSQTEFREDRELSKPTDIRLPTFVSVRATLQRCVECHRAEHAPVPDLANPPIVDRKGDMTYWAQKILGDLDPRDGKARKMPPASSQWQPTDDEVLMIRKWILAGAPDGDGHPLIAPRSQLEMSP